MRICSISMVKNEADIIESFVRFSLAFVDIMVILDNGSTDNTLNILQKIKAEGAAVDLVSCPSTGHDKELFMNELLAYTLQQYDPDFIIPLDADEFLSAPDNPRNILSQLPQDKVYSMLWRTYIPTDADPQAAFIPARITHHRDAAYERFKKVIVPGRMAKEQPLRLPLGHHSVEGVAPSSICNLKLLQMGHFPLRSQEQLHSKVITGELKTRCRVNRQEGDSAHWSLLYQKIKKGGHIDLTHEAMHYAHFSDAPCTLRLHAPLYTDFCSDLNIRYGDLAVVSSLENILNLSEQMAEYVRRSQSNLPRGRKADTASVAGVLALHQPLDTSSPSQKNKEKVAS